MNGYLQLTEEEIAKSKIEFNMHPSDSDEPFIERWLTHTNDEKATGKCEDCSYWNNRGGKRNYKNGELVLSFVRLDKDEWLFISAAIVIGDSTKAKAEVDVLTKYNDLYGKLIINTKKGYVFRRYSYYLSTHINDITVKERLTNLYTG